MFKNILVVCTGNICRSPMCEYILKKKLGEEFQISSAGIGALVGQTIDPTAHQINTDMISKPTWY